MPMPPASNYHNSVTNEYMRIRKGVVLLTPDKSRKVDEPLLPSSVEPLVITYDDMGSDSGLDKIDVESPNFGILYALVEWGMGLSPPYTEIIESTDKELKITFHNGDSIDILEISFFMKRMFEYAQYQGKFEPVPLQES